MTTQNFAALRDRLVNAGLIVQDLSARLEAEKLSRFAIEHELALAHSQQLREACEALLSLNEELGALQERLSIQAGDLQLLTEAAQRQHGEVESEVARRTVELSAANERLRQQDRYKDEFLRVISHELRTPLNFIMGFASVLEDEVAGPLNRLQHDSVRHILCGSDRMLHLVNDLLDYARVQAGKLDISRTEAAYAPLVQEVLASLQPLADQKRLCIEAELPTHLVLPVDCSRILQVLTNLIANAIKFTPEGGTVRIRAFLEGESLVTEIIDSGVGIPPEDLPRLFAPFQQVDMAATRSVRGTGLGLSIAKSLVESHGGRIGAASAGPGQGSCFRFTLPLVAEEVGAGGAPQA